MIFLILAERWLLTTTRHSSSSEIIRRVVIIVVSFAGENKKTDIVTAAAISQMRHGKEEWTLVLKKQLDMTRDMARDMFGCLQSSKQSSSGYIRQWYSFGVCFTAGTLCPSKHLLR